MATEREIGLPSFERPPLHEVAVGIGFQSLNCWGTTAPGEFWELVRERFPNSEDKPPLPPLPVGGTVEVELGFSDLPPVRRVWFASDDQSTLIQVQSDRIHVNWRRTAYDSEYPRYDYVLEQFCFALDCLVRFTEVRGERLQVKAGEVTYVNHIPQGDLWTSWNDLSSVFADWSVVPRNVGMLEAVSSLSTFNGGQEGTSFVSPGHHMTIEVKSAQRANDKSKIILLQFVNRGLIEAESSEEISHWLGIASADIVKSFAHVTAQSAHVSWGRKS